MFLPVSLCVFVELHVFLRIGNKTQNKFWCMLHNMIEAIPNEFIEKQSIRIMAAIAVKRLDSELCVTKSVLARKVETRKSFNAICKNKQLKETKK